MNDFGIANVATSTSPLNNRTCAPGCEFPNITFENTLFPSTSSVFFNPNSFTMKLAGILNPDVELFVTNPIDLPFNFFKSNPSPERY